MNEGERSLPENAQSPGQDNQTDANESPNEGSQSTSEGTQSTSQPVDVDMHHQDKQPPGKSGLNVSKKSAISHPDGSTDSGDEKAGTKPDPTRYGDWEKNGRCIDF